MEILNKDFKEIKDTMDPEVINDFLIKLSENPKRDYLTYIDYLIHNLKKQIFNKVKINLIFLIGEIGKTTVLNDRYLTFLLKTYYISDRWIRNEIIQAIDKISANSDIPDPVIDLISNAINDDYSLIKINSFRVILNLKVLPNSMKKNLFLTLNSKDSDLEALCTHILSKFLPDVNHLFNSLDDLENYKILKPYSIRIILLLYFRSLLNLESLRQKISNSNWEIEYKEIYFKEIDIYEKILLKNL
ncbi:MAG: hypothetical protein ACFFC3_05640 [Candidatus Odinarchaeota archaeon]